MGNCEHYYNNSIIKVILIYSYIEYFLKLFFFFNKKDSYI